MAGSEKIAVIGAGLMGHGIAQVFAGAGYAVHVYDPAQSALDALRGKIEVNLTAMKQDPAAAQRVVPCAALADAVIDAYIVFEAGPENLALKQGLFEEIERAAPPGALLASNTSVIPITQIMARLKRKDRALGTHWWNPPYLVPLVEVVQTADTGAEAIAHTSALLRAAGKTPVTLKKDVPGFVGNRLQHALWREAIALVQNGVCDAQTVDIVVKSSFGRRLAVLGPLENADLVGLDLTLAIHETILPDLDVTQGPMPYVRKLVGEGHLGMKCGEGFRKWTPAEEAATKERMFRHLLALSEREAADTQPKPE